VERSAAEPPVVAGELARLWERALATLAAFAGAGQAPAAPAPGPGRAADFWKRPPR